MQQQAYISIVKSVNETDLELQSYCRDILSKDEVRQTDRFHFKHDQLSYLTAHALLRICLSKNYNAIDPSHWEFIKNSFGQAHISNTEGPNNLNFSISHCRQWVACMITTGTVCGIDVESTNRVHNVISLASRFFSKSEADNLRALSARRQNDHFTILWTLKEAYAKARGLGLSLPFNSYGFQITNPPDNSIEFHPPSGDTADSWNFQLMQPDADHWAAMAIRQIQGEEINLIHNTKSLLSEII